MDAAMVERWNSVIKDRDTVYHLGDFTLGNYDQFMSFIHRLNGNIRILPGSHDHRWLRDFEPSDRVRVIDPLISVEFPEIMVDKRPQVIVMCHYSMRVWDKSHYGAYQLFGHSHGKLKGIGRSMDVGVDTNNFFPHSLEDIHQRLKDVPIHNAPIKD